VNAISPLRRLAIAAFALVCAAMLFRGNVASALVTRGDDVLRTGDVDGAVRYYDRAARIDNGSAVAADRLAFFLLMRRKSGDAARAYAAADAALRSVPRDPALLADRALAAMRLGRAIIAEHDFAAAADIAHDARYAHLAARMAARYGDRASARRYARIALQLDPRNAPANALLASLQR
jgi:tetratricopeptide (TPR) repeat protein